MLFETRTSTGTWQFAVCDQAYILDRTIVYVCQRLRKLLSSDDAAAGCR